MNKNKTLGERLKFARKKNNYSQKYVCELFNIKQSTFSSWERGISEPNHLMLLKLCRLYKIKNIMDFFTTDNVEEFFDSDQKMTIKTPLNDVKSYKDIIELRIENSEEKKLIENFRVLDERGKSAVMNCLKFELRNHNTVSQAAPPVIKHNYKFSMREIPIYAQPAAAGLGNYLDDENDFQIIQTEAPILADVGIRISGDSMQPIIENGSIAWVERCKTISNGEIGIFILNGNAYCKILKRDKSGVYLKSANSDYEDIRINEGDSLRVYGKVLI